MEITDEMRLAVHREDCARLGHQPNIGTALALRMDVNNGGVDIRADDDLRMPYITCQRCDATWIVMPVEASGYEAAEEAVLAALRADDPIAKDVKQKRNRRPIRERERAERAEKERVEMAEHAERLRRSAEKAEKHRRAEGGRPRTTTEHEAGHGHGHGHGETDHTH